jgi:hypothetical protein
MGLGSLVIESFTIHYTPCEPYKFEWWLPPAFSEWSQCPHAFVDVAGAVFVVAVVVISPVPLSLLSRRLITRVFPFVLFLTFSLVPSIEDKGRDISRNLMLHRHNYRLVNRNVLKPIFTYSALGSTIVLDLKRSEHGGNNC